MHQPVGQNCLPLLLLLCVVGDVILVDDASSVVDVVVVVVDDAVTVIAFLPVSFCSVFKSVFPQKTGKAWSCRGFCVVDLIL